MRAALLALPMLIAATVSAPAQYDDPYPWCALYFGDGNGGASSCWFMTLEQCRATVSGVGGYCRINPRHSGVAVEGQPAPRRARPRP